MLIAYMISGPVIGVLFVNMNCMQSTGNVTSGNDSFYIETGRTFDSGALRLECIARSARCYLRTGTDGLCGSSPFYCNLAVETQENFIGENGQVAFFTGWCYADDSRLAE